MSMIFEDFVPARRIEELKKKIKQLNKRAVKMGLPEMTLTVNTDLFEIREIRLEDADNVRKIKLRYVWVEIDGESPKFPGWNLKGVVDHVRDADLNKVSAVPGFELDPAYRTIKPTCDHCKTQRYRNKTFIVLHDDGRELRVGSGCIKDFLGHKNAEQILNHAKSLAFLDFNDYKDPSIGMGYTPDEFPVVDVMAYAAKHIRVHGWTSKGKAAEWGTMPTSAHVDTDFEDLNCGRGGRVEKPSEADVELAKAALAWISEFDLKDPAIQDYIYNCGLIAKTSMARYWEFGLVCSIVASYQNHLLKLTEQTLEKKTSDWVGEVGQKKFEVDVTFLKEWGFSGQWATVYIMKFVDADGNIFIWKTASPVSVKAGDKLKLVGTIKAHDEKYDTKQTVMTRCKYKLLVACNECETEFYDDCKDMYSFCSDDCRQKYADKLDGK